MPAKSPAERERKKRSERKRRQRPDVRERALAYAKEYRARPEVVERDRERSRAWSRSPAGKAFRNEPVERERRRQAIALLRMSNRELIHTTKLQSGCVDCGFKGHFAALHFDHVRGDKRANVAALVTHTRLTVLAEIAKCEVRCANCHAIITHERAFGVEW